MRKHLFNITIGLFIVFFSIYPKNNLYATEKTNINQNIEIKFFQLNLWVECTKVNNAPEYLIKQLLYLQPDIASFCELYKGPNDNPVIPKVINALKEKGLNYFSARIEGRAIISKYPILETERINKWMFKAILNIKGRRVAVYSTHSEYRFYSSYYSRGYNDGSTNWDKLPAPITNRDLILQVCNKSDRVSSAMDFIKNSKDELKKGAFVIFAGDMNEPSYLDWGKDTKDLYDHHGCIIKWSTSKVLNKHGFKDAYRTVYPNPVTHPGFTYPANNKDVSPKTLSWAHDADERERIDFVYYHPNRKIKITKANIVGPQGYIVYGKRISNDSDDSKITPLDNEWPSDHNGLLIIFSIL